MKPTQILAAVFLLLAVVAWLLPAAYALKRKKVRVAIVGLAAAPLVLLVYRLFPTPDTIAALFVIFMVLESAVWREARK